MDSSTTQSVGPMGIESGPVAPVSPVSPAPKVSVSMVTYNHERFIAQAIESVLMQQAPFPFELVISDDCSKDRTPEIVRAYQQKYPDIIRVLPRTQNMGMVPNFTDTMLACKGEYIALLEGDDYWTAPDKLQKQVDFLDAHPEHSGVGHNVRKRLESDPEKIQFVNPEDQKSAISVEDLYYTNLIPTCSFVFRRRNIQTLPDWFTTLGMGDWSLMLLNAHTGSIAYWQDVMAVYRIHDTNTWMGAVPLKRMLAMLEAVRCFQTHFGSHYAQTANQSLCYWLYTLSDTYEGMGDKTQARKYLSELLRNTSLRNFYANRNTYVRLLLRVKTPGLYYSLQKQKRSNAPSTAA